MTLDHHLVRVIACRLFGATPLPEPKLTYCHVDPQKQWHFNRHSNISILRKCIWQMSSAKCGYWDKIQDCIKPLYRDMLQKKIDRVWDAKSRGVTPWFFCQIGDDIAFVATIFRHRRIIYGNMTVAWFRVILWTSCWSAVSRDIKDASCHGSQWRLITTSIPTITWASDIHHQWQPCQV